MKQERIVRYTLEQIKKMPSDSDWPRLRAMTDAEIAANVASDPDAWETPPGFWDDATLVYPPRKKVVTLGLDDDVLAYFKRTGKGYQSRINAVLRTFMVRKSRELLVAAARKSVRGKKVRVEAAGLAEPKVKFRGKRK